MHLVESNYQGDDWWQFSAAEAEVFSIDAEQWPRMLEAWQVYEAFKGVTCDYAGAHDIEALRAKYPQWLTMMDGMPLFDSVEFSEFAATILGLTNREANAVFWKQEFWLVRNETAFFKDKRSKPSPASYSPTFQPVTSSEKFTSLIKDL